MPGGDVPPRRKKRTRLNWAPILWIILVFNVGFGLKYSKLFAPRVVRVAGAKAGDEARIAKVLESLNGKPAWNSPVSAVEEDLLRSPDMSSATIELNLLGRGLVTLTYDPPVAVFATRPTLGLNAKGGIVPVADATGLIKVRIYPQALAPLATFAAGWEMSLVADVCSRASRAELPDPEVELSENGSVQINLKSDARIVLGAPSDLDHKFQRLAQVRASDPELLSAGNELNLIAPDKPSIRKSEHP